MLAHVKKEHLASIRKKLDDLYVSPAGAMWQQNADRLLKAVAVYILKGGTNAPEDT